MRKRKIKFSFPIIIAIFAIVAIIAEVISHVSADEEKKPYTSYRDSVLGIPGDFAVFTLEDASVTEVTADIAVGGDFLSGSFGNYNTWWKYFYKAYDLRHVNLNSYVRGEFKSNVGYNWTAEYTKDELTTKNGTIKGSYDVGNTNGKANLYLNTNNNTFDDSISANQTKINDTMYDNRNHTEGDLTYKSYNIIGVDYEFIDFEKEFENLQTASTRLWNLSNQEEVDCIPTDGTQTYTYNFPSDKDVVVIKVDSENFYKHDQMNTFDIANFDESKKIVINVDSKDYIDKKTPKITVNGKAIDCDILAEDILFNFYSSEIKTEESLETNEIVGTILAPNLNIRVNGNLDGAVIARKVTAQQAIYGINLNISWADLEEPEKIQIPVTKSWDDNDNEYGNRPENVTIYVKKGSETVDTITLTGPDWTSSSKELPKEDDNGDEITYTVDEDVPSGYLRESTSGNQTDGFIITNKPETVVLRGSKSWSDDNNRDGIRPNKVIFNIYDKNDTTKSVGTIEVTEQESGSWTGESKALPKYKNKQLVEYDVREDDVPNGYRIGPSASASSNTYAINNVHDPETLKIDVEKIWNDNNNQDGARPESIEVGVFNGETKVDTITLTGPNWKGTSKSLYKNENGSAIPYTVRELTEIPGYIIGTPTGSIEGGFKIENTYTTETVQLNVEKVWDDSNNQDGKRPDSVTFKVYNGTTQVGDAITLTKDNGWKGTSSVLPKKSNGKDINYTIKEDPVPAGYTASEPVKESNGTYKITNTHTPGMTTVYAKKVWNDEDDADKIRPKSITVNVKKGETVVDTLTLSADNGWAATSKELPAKDGGATITYNVEEEGIPSGYTVSKSGDQSTGFTITNTHTVTRYVEFDVEKIWIDKDNAEGKRPANITVKVLKNGEEIESQELNSENSWKRHFKYTQESEDDVYTIKEESVDLYQTKVEGSVDKGFTITNTYIEQVKTGIINININKYIEGTTDTLANAKIKVTIKDKDDKVAYTKEAKTDKNGNIYISGIELNLDTDYILEVEETEAPSGYSKSKEVIKANFKITKEDDGVKVSMTSDNKNITLSGNEFSLKLENKKNEEPKTPEILPQTGSNVFGMIALIVVSVLASRIIYVKYKRNKLK